MGITKRPIDILVADDDVFIRHLFRSYLEKLNCNLRLVNDGETALLEARESKPDMLFLDLVMPNMDGFEALRSLRAQPELANLPIVMVSSRSDVDTIMQALRQYASDFMPKPFTRSKLIHKIHFLLLEEQQRHMIHEVVFVDEIAPVDHDPKALQIARKRFIANFDHVYIHLIHLIDLQEGELVKRIAWRLLYGINVFQLTTAKGKLVQMMAAVKKSNYDQAIEHLENVYTYFEDFSRKLPQ